MWRSCEHNKLKTNSSMYKVIFCSTLKFMSILLPSLFSVAIVQDDPAKKPRPSQMFAIHVKLFLARFALLTSHTHDCDKQILAGVHTNK